MPKTRTFGELDDVNTESEPEVSSADQDMLMRHLLLMPAVLPPRVTPIPSDREQLIQRLMGTEHPVQPVLHERSSLTDMDSLLQNLLPVGSLEGENMRPTVDRHESTVACFSCGKSGHATSRYPVLVDSFPFLPPGWQIGWTGDGFILRPPPKGADRHQAGNVV